MCGRFTITNPEAVAKHYGIKIMPGFKARYNIAPGQIVPIITNKDQKEFTPAKWGLIPHWAKEEKTGYKMINARAESLTERPAYREPLEHKRCLIPTDGFYEWQKLKNKKYPYYLKLKDNAVFSLAGLYDIWHGPKGKNLITFTIITVPSNSLAGKIHDRMPAILNAEQEKAWLADVSGKALAETVLKPFSAAKMKAIQISDLVNSPIHDNKAVIQPIK